MHFEDRVVLITGAAGGLGRELALGFARAGADVVINYHRSECAAHETASAVGALGRRALALRADVSVPEQVEGMVAEAIARFGRVDVLVNNSAITRDAPVWKLSSADWNAVLDAGLTSVFLCTKTVVPQMRARGYGRIVNVSSIVPRMGVFGTAAYAAAKAGISGFSRTVAREVVRKGITINTILAGYLDTGMCLALPPEMRAQIVTQIPIGRFGTPAEIVSAALFLASEQASYITGQELCVSGGMLM